MHRLAPSPVGATAGAGAATRATRSLSRASSKARVRPTTPAPRIQMSKVFAMGGIVGGPYGPEEGGAKWRTRPLRPLSGALRRDFFP